MIDAELFSACYPWDAARDGALRGVRVTDPDRLDPLAPLNQSLQIETTHFHGQEGYDYQNPHAFASKDVFALKDADLRPNFGIVGDTSRNVALNVQATSGIIAR